jgi:hypothetical protein
MWLLKSPLDQNPIMIYHKFMVILKVTSILGGQKEDKWMIWSITLTGDPAKSQFNLGDKLQKT